MPRPLQCDAACRTLNLLGQHVLRIMFGVEQHIAEIAEIRALWPTKPLKFDSSNTVAATPVQTAKATLRLDAVRLL